LFRSVIRPRPRKTQRTAELALWCKRPNAVLNAVPMTKTEYVVPADRPLLPGALCQTFQDFKQGGHLRRRVFRFRVNLDHRRLSLLLPSPSLAPKNHPSAGY
jgi:hypothetical protein